MTTPAEAAVLEEFARLAPGHDRADVAQTFSAIEINDFPNIGRNLQAMELLNPGAAKAGFQHASDENPQGSVQMVVNGQFFSAIGYELDGTTNQDPIQIQQEIEV